MTSCYLVTQHGGSDLPVHLKGGPSQLLIYRGAMIGSFVGIGVAFYAIYSMATGRMKKKEQ